MTETLSDAEYDTLVSDLVETALEDMRDRSDVPTDDPETLTVDGSGVQQAIEKAVLFTGHDAFGGKSLAAFEDEMTAAFAGSIVDHADASLPDEVYDTRHWDSSTHFQQVAKNYLYTDVKRAVTNHFRRQVNSDSETPA